MANFRLEAKTKKGEEAIRKFMVKDGRVTLLVDSSAPMLSVNFIFSERKFLGRKMSDLVPEASIVQFVNLAMKGHGCDGSDFRLIILGDSKI